MLLFKNYFKGKKLNASEVAIAVNDDKYKALNNFLKDKELNLLWENENPNVEFSAQNIVLKNDDYDYLIWVAKETASVVRVISLFSPKSFGVTFTLALDGQTSNNQYINTNWYRRINPQDDLNFQIEDCKGKRGTEASSLTNNVYMIPYAVYGGKF